MFWSLSLACALKISDCAYHLKKDFQGQTNFNNNERNKVCAAALRNKRKLFFRHFETGGYTTLDTI